MSIQIKSVVTAHRAKPNPELGGAIDILGSFDEMIQPLFPVPLANMAMVITFEGLTRNTMFEMRLNGPDDELISKGEFGVAVSPLGVGKKIVDIEKFLIQKRGKYTIDILEKTEAGVKFIKTCDLFTAAYPPKRPFREGELEAILGSKEDVIKTIKTEFKPVGAEEAVRLQLNISETQVVEEGHILFPANDKLELGEKEYDLTGLRRQMEWMLGRPIPKKQEQEKSQEK